MSTTRIFQSFRTTIDPSRTRNEIDRFLQTGLRRKGITQLAPVADKRLVLTASQDSFIRVTSQDSPDADKPLYASVLHSGQSIGFDGRKFSINVGVPSAVDIKLDGVNYGPHSDQGAPETFTVESHLQ